jgi:hypothetical protein
MNGVYVYFRHDDAQTVMVILNNNDDAKKVETKRFAEMIRGATTGTDVVSGNAVPLAGSIDVAARSATILELR